MVLTNSKFLVNEFDLSCDYCLGIALVWKRIQFKNFRQLLEKYKKKGDEFSFIPLRHFILYLPINGAAAARDQYILP
jgi:hypothetical protein